MLFGRVTAAFTISLLLTVGGLIAKFLAEYLTERPEGKAYSPEEALEEMEAAFVPRNTLMFAVHERSIPIMLHRLAEGVGLGFGTRQAETLSQRMMNQSKLRYLSAAYPVEVSGVPSDLEFQWCREGDNVRLAICSVEEVLLFATDAVADLAIEHHS